MPAACRGAGGARALRFAADDEAEGRLAAIAGLEAALEVCPPHAGALAARDALVAVAFWAGVGAAARATPLEAYTTVKPPEAAGNPLHRAHMVRLVEPDTTAAIVGAAEAAGHGGRRGTRTTRRWTWRC